MAHMALCAHLCYLSEELSIIDRGTDELDELQMIDITTPQGIDAMREAHQDDRVIVECLSISPVATCTTNSITISWTPPTKNIDRIVDYKVSLCGAACSTQQLLLQKVQPEYITFCSSFRCMAV